MRKVLFFVLCTLASTLHVNSCYAEDDKSHLIKSITSEFKEIFKVSLAEMQGGRAGANESAQLVEFFAEQWGEKFSKILNEGFEAFELVQLHNYLATPQAIENKKIAEKSAKAMANYFEAFKKGENPKIDKSNLPDSYRKLLKGYLQQEYTDLQFFKIFKQAVALHPVLVEGLSAQQVSEKEREFVEQVYDLVMNIYADLMSEATFKFCVEFEMSKLGRRFDKAIEEANQQLMG